MEEKKNDEEMVQD